MRGSPAWWESFHCQLWMFVLAVVAMVRPSEPLSGRPADCGLTELSNPESIVRRTGRE